MSEFAMLSTMILLAENRPAAEAVKLHGGFKGIDPALVYLWLKKTR